MICTSNKSQQIQHDLNVSVNTEPGSGSTQCILWRRNKFSSYEWKPPNLPSDTNINKNKSRGTLIHLLFFFGFTEFKFELKREAFNKNVIIEFSKHLYSTVELLDRAQDDCDECLLTKLPHDCFISYQSLWKHEWVQCLSTQPSGDKSNFACKIMTAPSWTSKETGQITASTWSSASKWPCISLEGG